MQDSLAVERIGTFDREKLERSFGLVRFRSSPQARYALDLGDESWYLGSVKVDSFYREFATEYPVPWKLIPLGERDVVEAYHDGSKDIDLSRVRFASTPDSSALPADYDEARKAWRLTLPTTESNSTYEVFALYQGKVIGKLRVVSYPKQSYRIRLVPVNDQSVGDVSRLSEYLNGVYNKVGVNFSLTLSKSFDLEFSGKNIKQDLNKLRDSYEERHPLKKDEVCVFMPELSKSSKLEDVEGLMARKSRFGYLFLGKTLEVDLLAHTLAHELGHGLFTLQHTFDKEYWGKRSKGNTKNLMDYAGKKATELAAYQWNIIANPAIFTGTDRAKDAQLLKKGTIWLTPDWQPFVYDESNQISTSDDETIPNGSISGIALHSHSKKVYTYNKQTHRYEYKDGMGMDTLAIKYVLQINEEDIVHLLDRKSGVAGVVYSAKWKDIKHSIYDSTLFLSSAVNFVREVASNQFVEHPEIHVQYTARYICDEIKKNIGTSEASVMKAANSVAANNNMAHNPIRGEQPTLLPKMFGNAFSYFVWTLKVMPEGDWDHKRKIKKFQTTDYCCDKRFIHPMQFKFDLWSNIHYGFIEAYVGFTEFELMSGAGFVQIFTNPQEQLDKNMKINQQIFPIPANKLVAQYDDPSDQQAILIGIRLFKKFENRIHDLSPNDILREIYNVYQQGLPISVKQCDKH